MYSSHQIVIIICPSNIYGNVLDLIAGKLVIAKLLKEIKFQGNALYYLLPIILLINKAEYSIGSAYEA